MNEIVLGKAWIHYRSDDENDLLSLEKLKELRKAGPLIEGAIAWHDEKK